MIIEKNHGKYLEIILNHPDKHHAITLEMAEQLDQMLDHVDLDHHRFVLIRGAGSKAFCSGGDLKTFHGHMTEDEAFDKLMVMNKVLEKITYLQIPTIALLNGHAFGGGCELATACDFRLAYEGLKFGFIQANLGILPGWGGDALLYEKLNHSHAFHWMTSGEKYESKDLYQMGWIHSLIKPEAEETYLSAYLNKSAEQMQLLKAAYISQLSPALKLNMTAGTKRCAKLWGSAQHQQALNAFFEK